MDHSQISHAKNETVSLAIVKLLHKAEDSTLSKVQKTVDIQMTKTK